MEMILQDSREMEEAFESWLDAEEAEHEAKVSGKQEEKDARDIARGK